MVDCELSWIAGFFDGEGCVYLSPNGARRVYVVNTYKPTLDSLCSKYGGRVKKQGANPLTKQQAYVWVCSGEDAVGFLKSIFPYLRIKRSEAELLLSLPPAKPTAKKIGKGLVADSRRKEILTETRKALTEIKRGQRSRGDYNSENVQQAQR